MFKDIVKLLGYLIWLLFCWTLANMIYFFIFNYDELSFIESYTKEPVWFLGFIFFSMSYLLIRERADDDN
jgi:hypothetical protein